MTAGRSLIKINRAPVLTLWAAVVAQRLGFSKLEALTLGRAVAGLNAYSKGVALGIFTPSPKKLSEQRRKLKPGRRLHVDLLHRSVPVRRTPQGLRALSGGRPIAPASVQRYLEGKFGPALSRARAAMVRLARSRSPAVLGRTAYPLYVKFRPAVAAGTRGWGAKGSLDLRRVTALARR